MHTRTRKVWIVLACSAFVLAGAGLFVWNWPSDGIRSSREAVLRQNLFTMRDLMQQYSVDKGHRPQSLDDLIQDGYAKQIPTDPMTGRNDSWILERSKGPETGIINIRSGSRQKSIDGSTYDTW